MRIISGTFKGRRLYPPADSSVRPTPDRVKEALFSILGNRIWNATVVDLFSGSGNLGLEALSRGARKCYFGDNAKESIRLIHKNVTHCKAEHLSQIIQGDYRNVLSQLKEQADIVFVDPPYHKQLWSDVMELLAENKILSQDGVVVLEHPKETVFPQELFGFRKIKEARYGTVVLSIYMC